MAPRLKIRGIYSTGLTKLALDSGFEVTDPSPQVTNRFGREFHIGPHDILLHDREDLQGVALEGEADVLSAVLAKLQEVLLDAVIVGFRPREDSEPMMVATLELAGGAKQVLDELRSTVTPTLKYHHRLKLIDAQKLESAESRLSGDAGLKDELERTIFREAIIAPLEKEGLAKVEHVKAFGKPIRPREGLIQSINESRIVFKRNFSKGRYDGLDLIIRKGDFCLTEVREGAWFIKHNYYSKERLLIGEYYNVNTPVELYPYGARYVDLEVDVIRRPGEDAFLVDREKLTLLSREGCIARELESRAMVVAEQILRSLNRERK